MKRIKLRKFVMYAIALLFSAFVVFFVIRYINNGKNWAFYETNRHVYTNGDITNIGTITDMNSNVLAETVDGKRVYSENKNVRKATLHIVGDRNGFVSTGVQNALKDRLTDYSLVNGIYTYSNKGNNMKLTVNSEISVAAMNAMGNFAGCMGLYNYKTGEVLCIISTPTFDIDDENDMLKAENGEYTGVYINRFLSSVYTPGSTFKMVTSAASFSENGEGAYDIAFNCDKGTVFDGEKLTCVGRHKEVSLKRAFSHSCNAYFSSLAVELGRNVMEKYAEMFGFNKTFYIDGIKAADSHYEVSSSRDIDFGWSGIGQYTDLCNPLQYLSAVGAVANDGICVKPYIVSEITSSEGRRIYTAKKKETRMLNTKIANQVADLMDYAVEDNYGKSTFGNLDVCGKTGTAEVAEKAENSLFVGFCKDENLPLAFVCVVERGGSGKGSALNVVNKTLQTAKKVLTH